MHVALVYNPRSGQGHGRGIAESLAHHARRDGHSVDLLPTGPHADDAWNDRVHAACTHAGALVIVGGDGTVRTALAASQRRTPIYHVPAGTENLLARQFGSDATPDRLLSALRRNHVAHVDVGQADGLFTLMTSVGPDAGVLNLLHSNRGESITHLSYAPVILKEYARTRLPRVTIEADGRTIVNQEQGWVVVAVSRSYAFEVNPCPDADPTDGLLDIAFFPVTTPGGMLRAMIASWFRLHSGARRWRAAHVRLSSDAPLPAQSDGDWLGFKPSLDLSVIPQGLPVLLPA